MNRRGLILSVLYLLLSTSLCYAQTDLVQHRDATSGRMTHLGEDVGIYSDSHDRTGPVARPGSPSLPDAHGDTLSTTTTPFGTPIPPNQLTSPPLLPMNPNRSLAPQQPSAPQPSGPSSGFTPSGGGRFGR